MTLPADHFQSVRRPRRWRFLAIWVVGSICTGLLLWARNLASIGGEAAGFVFVGLSFGLVAGVAFVFLYRLGRSSVVAALLKGAGLGALASLPYIAIDFVSSVRSGAQAYFGRYDLALAGLGAVLGAICAVTSRERGSERTA